MKKTLLLISFILVLSSCTSDTESSSNISKTSVHNSIIKQEIASNTYKLTIEGHEYFMFKEPRIYATAVSVVHSASCPCGWIGFKKEE